MMIMSIKLISVIFRYSVVESSLYCSEAIMIYTLITSSKLCDAQVVGNEPATDLEQACRNKAIRIFLSFFEPMC